MSSPGPFERAAQTRRLLRREGVAGLTSRLLSRASRLISPASGERIKVARADLHRAGEIAASGWRLPPARPLGSGEPLEVAWVCVPPSPGAGGFTTISRLAGALEQAGHRCTVYLQDRHGWAIEQHERRIRGWWPSLRADIRDLDAGIGDHHAIFATSWETAYPVLTSPARGTRFYLVQDFEPAFYAAGSEALLAEATYRFGFHGVTAGRWLAGELKRRYAMTAEHFDFGCDLESYRLENRGERRAVCMYSRPSTPRRAFELAVSALDLFAERHPEIEIHTYGESPGRLPFAATDHGVLSPDRLNALYNRCIAGLCLSATNISLVPHEMLAAGCIPVVNDAEHNRVVLDNPQVAYAPATPFELAATLAALVEQPASERAAAASAAAASVQGASWQDAGRTLEHILTAAIGAATKSNESTELPEQRRAATAERALTVAAS